ITYAMLAVANLAIRAGPGRTGTFRARAKPSLRGRVRLGLGYGYVKNIPIDLELDDDKIRIAEEGDQVPEIQTNPNTSRSCSQFQDSCSLSANMTSKRARTTSNVWYHFDPEFKDKAD
ncbi:hypothetical protein PanWU01x14_365230, partial [Parasponia andersonii]